MSPLPGTTTADREAIALIMVRRAPVRGEFPVGNVVSLDGFSRVFPHILNEVYRGKLTFTEGGLEVSQFEGACVSFSSSVELGRLGRSQVPYLLTWASESLLPLKVRTILGAPHASPDVLLVSLIGYFHAAYLIGQYGQLFDRHADPVINITRPGGLHA